MSGCLKWTIESVSEQPIESYQAAILDPTLIEQQIKNPQFDDFQYIFTVDVSILATGFGQLVDEGIINPIDKPILQLAIQRQKIWATLQPTWDGSECYLNNLTVLERVLKEA